ncbi:MAG: NAD(P)-binding domain-containing protein [Devosia sp.]
MTTAIIGLGNMGKGLARRLAGKIDLILASHDGAAVAAFAASLGDVRAASVEEAMVAADIVIIAVPYAGTLELAASPALKGKVVVDMTNPVNAEFSGLLLGHTTSAAEQIQQVAKDAKVVKAFNTIFAAVLDAPVATTATVPVFLAGDDAAAVDAVADLVVKAGFAADKTGPLDVARLLEPLGMLNIRFGYGMGRGTEIVPTWLSVSR